MATIIQELAADPRRPMIPRRPYGVEDPIIRHMDMDRVERWTLICTCLVLVLTVGLGHPSADGQNFVDQGTLDWINDAILVFLGMLVLYAFKVLLNRLGACRESA